MDHRQIAAEFARLYRLRPRAAWREAYGWSLVEAADRINSYRDDTGLDPDGFSGMTGPHLCEYENWPGSGEKVTGRKPSPWLLAALAGIYGCHVAELVDFADRAHLPAADLLVLDSPTTQGSVPAAQAPASRDVVRAPNLVLRRIREQERQESRSEFAEALSRTARAMGESVQPSERYVARLEDGDIRYPRPASCRVLVELCGRPMSQLGFGSRFARPEQLLATQESGGKQTEMIGVAIEATPNISSVSSLETSFPLSFSAISAERALSANDPQTIAFVSEALSYYARTANMLGGGHLVELSERNICFVYSGYGEARGKYRDQILITCARYAEFLGWLHQDLGNPVHSLFWTDRALEWAQEANADPQFTSYVLMRKSDHAEQYGTADRVIALAESSLKVTTLSPRAKALAIQQEARGYSQRGDDALFERKLDEAREAILKAEGSGDAPWGEYCDLTYIAMQEASGRIELGQFDKAIEIMERELPGMPSADRVDSTVFRARLARAYAEAGYGDRAAETALGACRDTRATASIRAFTELFRVRQRLADHGGNHPIIASFIDAFDPTAREFVNRTRQAR